MTGRLTRDGVEHSYWLPSRLTALRRCPGLFLRTIRLVRALLRIGFDVTTHPNWQRIDVTRGGERLSGDLFEDRGQFYFHPVDLNGKSFDASERVLEAFEQALISVGFPKQPLTWSTLAYGRNGVRHAQRRNRKTALCGAPQGTVMIGEPDATIVRCEACETIIREKGL